MTKKGLIAVLLALLTALTPVFASAAPNSDYTLVSPYKDVDWSSRKAYKTGAHPLLRQRRQRDLQKHDIRRL